MCEWIRGLTQWCTWWQRGNNGRICQPPVAHFVLAASRHQSRTRSSRYPTGGRRCPMIDVKSCCIHPPTTNDSARLRRTSWQNSSSSGHNAPVHSVPATMLTTCLFLKTLVARWVRPSITPTGRFTHSTTCLIAHAAGWLLVGNQMSRVTDSWLNTTDGSPPCRVHRRTQ